MNLEAVAVIGGAVAAGAALVSAIMTVLAFRSSNRANEAAQSMRDDRLEWEKGLADLQRRIAEHQVAGIESLQLGHVDVQVWISGLEGEITITNTGAVRVRGVTFEMEEKKGKKSPLEERMLAELLPIPELTAGDKCTLPLYFAGGYAWPPYSVTLTWLDPPFEEDDRRTLSKTRCQGNTAPTSLAEFRCWGG